MDKRIGFGYRFAALLVDAILVSVVGALATPSVGALLGGAAAVSAEGLETAGRVGMLLGSMASLGLVGTVYFLLEGLTGFSLGKLVLGLRICSEDGHRAGLPRLLLRYTIKNVGSIMILIAGLTGAAIINTLGGLLGLVMFLGMFMVLGQARQTLHDQLAKTSVLKRTDVRRTG